MEYVKRIRDLREDNDKTQLEIANRQYLFFIFLLYLCKIR